MCLFNRGPHVLLLPGTARPLATERRVCCEHRHASRYSISPHYFCAGEVGRDSCAGDSGGPLVVDINGTIVQIGEQRKRSVVCLCRIRSFGSGALALAVLSMAQRLGLDRYRGVRSRAEWLWRGQIVWHVYTGGSRAGLGSKATVRFGWSTCIPVFYVIAGACGIAGSCGIAGACGIVRIIKSASCRWT